MQFNVGYASDIGLRRSQNQDSGIVLPELGLFVVADGMGGHQGGEIASALAVETIVEQVRATEIDPSWDPKPLLNDAIQAANFAIYDRSLKEPRLQGMGTTTTALLFKDGKLTIGHVGDSRCYLIRSGAIWQLTRDHSLVQEKLRAGLISREQAKTDQMKNVITRSVGFGQETRVELYEVDAASGDIYLICSDGLSGQVEDSEILDVVNKHLDSGAPNPLQVAVRDLITWANSRGGYDNTTVALIQVK